jgi:hypothetical protein
VKYLFHSNGLNVQLRANGFSYVPKERSPAYDKKQNTPGKPNGVLNVYRFKKVTYKNIYNNIDLEFSLSPKILWPVEYNFIVRPGGKVSDIKMKFNGVKHL